MWARRSMRIGLAVVSAASVLVGCSGGTSNSGVRLITITDENLETVGSDLCAVQGNATNSGNVRARVEITYEARNTAGGVIGTSTASFEVAAFSNFAFRHAKLNSEGQPSSSVFTNGLACSGISSFKRVETHTANA